PRDLRREPRPCVLRPAPEPAAPDRRPGGTGRPRLARAGEAAALRQLRDGRARRDDRLPDEHETAAMVSAATDTGRAAAPVRTAAIANLGCKVNQAEMEAAARLLRERGISIVDGHERADLVLVNTCTVTSEADAKSRHAVRRARRASPEAEIVVTGCSVQVGREAFAEADPAARLVDNRSKDALLRELAEIVGPAFEDGRVDRALPTLSGVEIEGIADGRASVERTRAFVKVQDGCSFFCTYCIIPA